MESDRAYHTEYMRKWRVKNKQKDIDSFRKRNDTTEQKLYLKEWEQRNKEKRAEQKKQYYQDNKEYFRRKSREHHKANKKKRQLVWQIKRRLVLEHYGNKCNCCNESMLQFLAIDHINNDGYLERKTRTINIFDYLIRNNYPDTFQILCHNCNLAKSFYGECPHKCID